MPISVQHKQQLLSTARSAREPLPDSREDYAEDAVEDRPESDEGSDGESEYDSWQSDDPGDSEDYVERKGSRRSRLKSKAKRTDRRAKMKDNADAVAQSEHRPQEGPRPSGALPPPSGGPRVHSPPCRRCRKHGLDCEMQEALGAACAPCYEGKVRCEKGAGRTGRRRGVNLKKGRKPARMLPSRSAGPSRASPDDPSDSDVRIVSPPPSDSDVQIISPPPSPRTQERFKTKRGDATIRREAPATGSHPERRGPVEVRDGDEDPNDPNDLRLDDMQLGPPPVDYNPFAASASRILATAVRAREPADQIREREAHSLGLLAAFTAVSLDNIRLSARLDKLNAQRVADKYATPL
ncbi:hypothetical protein PUNSTDRAFT_139413 [Punctularia strigosozonata HHB-11173 SS5]|uniref:Zn(2)-C6 fungal-type domain-containing protein n=1 Tax=Punctularia strigosozonata (strain HHB-11173) TaxID=741275 RepID=R7S102_PUNST|nr:uncharacterized protein PUNSTDRAFT_139413 [Punctularia strigosozonata HHB-11173 SS5]EIN03529.1 hypothetical protein PUNSTDRAFT_139413 [Punctularia strigosozonata HHB-11173 SS5]